MSEAIIDITTREERREEQHQNSPAAPEPETSFMLRVLSGAQAGAQITLDARRYKLGTNEECDIVLIGENIIPHHISLFFADSYLSITHAHAPVYLDQNPVKTLPLDLEPMQVFTLGNIAFAFGPENGDWPAQNTIDEVIKENTSDNTLVPVLRPDTLPAFVLLTLRQKLGLHKIENIIKFAFAATLAISLVIIMIAFSLHSTEKPISIAYSAADRLHTHIKSDPAFAHIQLINTLPKKQLIGYVARTADFNRLYNLSRGAHIDLNVFSIEKLDKSLNVITALYDARLAYKLTPGKGRNINLFLYGTIKSENAREKIREQLNHDLPTISDIKTNIITQDEAMSNISTWLAQYPNFSGLSAKFHQKSIAIEGNLLNNFRKSWEKAVQKNPPHLMQNMMPNFNVHFGPHFPARIVSLVTGENAQIRLVYKNQNGKNNSAEISARIGDRLKSGFTLKKIARDHITIKWRGRDFIYPIPN